MCSILSGTQAVRSPQTKRRTWESLVAFIHATPASRGASVHIKRKPGRAAPNAPSRTRLVKDLKPTHSTLPQKLRGKFEVAPRVRPSRNPTSRGSTSRSPTFQKRNNEWDESPRRPWTSDDQSRPTISLPSPSLRLSGQPRPSNSSTDKIPPRSQNSDHTRKAKIINPLGSEFDISTKPENASHLPQSFSSPPLMDGLLSSLIDVLGPDARPTPIQALSLKHLFRSPRTYTGTYTGTGPWRQFLLASETGSGKSIAYLLPMLQSLKQSELEHTTQESNAFRRALNPRGLVLAPTHELSRQLAGFAKALLHNIKLRVFCASRANIRSKSRVSGTASKMAAEFGDSGEGEFEVRANAKQRPVDVLVGTPMKVLEMARGRGWNWGDRNAEGDRNGQNVEEQWDLDERGRKVRQVKRDIPTWEPEMGLEGIEWVVVDEADVLFDPDFQESTRMLLADIATARGFVAPVESASTTPTSDSTPKSIAPHLPSSTSPLSYPFNLILTTATIPAALASYLDTHHPSLTRLASPHLHRLPRTLQTEYVAWTGGNRNADVERRIRRVWAEDAGRSGARSKVLIFCNRSTKVEDLGRYLEEKGIGNVALTSASETRKRGSNHHLDGFLRTSRSESTPSPTSTSPPSPTSSKEDPHVMITTSLLSRGLDFSPAIRHVFIMDEPRNMIDFLHRAGRSGRAGERGKVVVFGKMHGRGSLAAKEVRKKVGALAA